MAAHLMGIDAGGTMTKVALYDETGEEIACEHRPNRTLFPHKGWTERDPEAKWDATCSAIRALMEKTGTDPADIAAITPAGYGAGLYFLDGEGRSVRNAIGSTDMRSSGVIRRWRENGVAAQIEAQISAAVWPGQSLAILGWFHECETEALERSAHLLSCKDFLRLRLTGDISTDPTDAGCAGFVDLRNGRYAEDAFHAAGLSACLPKLAPIGRSDAIAGRLSREAADRTGLLEGTPVARGVYDVVACSLSSGLDAASQLGVVAGTFSINSVISDRPMTRPLPHLNVQYPWGDRFLATMATPTSASNLEWVCKTLLAAETERTRTQGRSIYEFCSELVEQAGDGSDQMLFFPFLFGGPEGAPAGLLGAEAGAGLDQVLRAVFEGIVFAHRDDADGLAQAAGVRSIRLAGGPSRSAVWSQIFADAFNLPVDIANGSEFGAKGAAMCGAVAVGLQPDLQAAGRTMVRMTRTHLPDPGRVAMLQPRFERYRRVRTELAGIWSGEDPASVVLPAAREEVTA